MPTLAEFAAKKNRDAADSLKRTVAAMPSDRENWTPFENARDAHDQVVECAGANYMFAQTLRARAFPPFSPSALEELKANNETMNKAVSTLDASTEALIAAIHEFPAEHLDDAMPHPFNPDATITFADVMLMPYWHMTYHLGQISYIQTGYGDTKMYW